MTGSLKSPVCLKSLASYFSSFFLSEVVPELRLLIQTVRYSIILAPSWQHSVKEVVYLPYVPRYFDFNDCKGNSKSMHLDLLGQCYVLSLVKIASRGFKKSLRAQKNSREKMCLPHELLIVNLNVCGFEVPSTKLIYSYLRNRKQGV